MSCQRKELVQVTEQCSRSQEELYQLEKEILELVHQQEQWQREQQLQDHSLSVVTEEIQRLQQKQEQQQERMRQLKGEFDEKKASRRKLEGVFPERQKSLQQLKQEASRAQEQLHLMRSDQKVLQGAPERLAAPPWNVWRNKGGTWRVERMQVSRRPREYRGAAEPADRGCRNIGVRSETPSGGGP